MRLIVATHNPGKVKEMEFILQGTKIEVVGAEDVGITEEPEEDGVTLEENALKKAHFVSVRTHAQEWVLADDTGLFIDALDGAPGVHSKRWGGQAENEHARMARVLKSLQHVPEGKRGATFKSAVAVIAPDGRHWIFHGEMRGTIPTAPRGILRPTLPYDVLIVPEGDDRTFAEMSEEEKNSISQRGKAFVKVKRFLQNQIPGQ